MDNNYDQISFVSKPSYLRHPDHLAVMGKLFGIETATASTSSVLEIGCGDGSNIIPFALNNQKAEVLGIDLSGKQIASGNQVIRQLGLNNIKLRDLDILTWKETEQNFDYIVCHGLFSWSSAEVQEKILQILSINLKPRGVALISYNCLPGWEVRAAVRDIVRRFDRENIKKPFSERISAARNFLENYREAIIPRIHYHRWQVEKEVTNILRQSEGYLFYELLADKNEAFFVSEIIRQAALCNLEYLGDSKYSRTGYYGVIKDIEHSVGIEQIALAEEESNSVRPFAYRESLFCRQNAREDKRINCACLKNFSYSSMLVPAVNKENTKEFYLSNGQKYQIPSQLLRDVVNILYDSWPEPVSFTKIAASINLRKDDEQYLYFELLKLLKDDVLDVYEVPPIFAKEIGQIPAVNPFALIQLEKQNWATNYRHEYLEFDQEERKIVALLDGKKTVTEISKIISELNTSSDDVNHGSVEEILEKLRSGAFLKINIQITT